MKSIPASLLTDTVTVYPMDETSDFATRYGDAVTYEHVRMDFGLGLGSGSASGFSAVHTQWGQDEQISALLFIDAIRSRPAAPPPVNARVEMEQDGQTFSGTVQSVKTFKAHGRKTHHWEVLI